MNKNCINHVIKSILEDVGILDEVMRVDPIVAGGSVADLLRMSVEHFNEIDPNRAITGDIDIYVPYLDAESEDPFNYVAECKNLLGKIEMQNNFQMKILPGNPFLPKINLIRCRDFKGNYVYGRNLTEEDVDKLVSRFDLECIKCGLLLTTIDSHSCLYIQESATEYIFNKIAKISANGLHLNKLYGLLARLYKYKKKGFKIAPENESLLLSKAAVSGYNLDNILPSHTSDEDFYMMNSDTVKNFSNDFRGCTIQEIIDTIYGRN